MKLKSGHREIDWDDELKCTSCGHVNSLYETIVRGFESEERQADESEYQFVLRFLELSEETETTGEVECTCGETVEWVSPEGTEDVQNQ
jgi:hypothetical protein